MGSIRPRKIDGGGGRGEMGSIRPRKMDGQKNKLHICTNVRECGCLGCEVVPDSPRYRYGFYRKCRFFRRIKRGIQ